MRCKKRPKALTSPLKTFLFICEVGATSEVGTYEGYLHKPNKKITFSKKVTGKG